MGEHVKNETIAKKNKGVLDGTMWTVYHVLMDSELRSINPDVPDTDAERLKYIRSRIKKLPKSSQSKAIVKLKRIIKSVPSISEYTKELLNELDTEEFRKDLALYSKISRNIDAENSGLQTLDPQKLVDLVDGFDDNYVRDSSVRVLVLDRKSMLSRFGSEEAMIEYAETTKTYCQYFSTNNPKTSTEFVDSYVDTEYVLQPVYLDIHRGEHFDMDKVVIGLEEIVCSSILN